MLKLNPAKNYSRGIAPGVFHQPESPGGPRRLARFFKVIGLALMPLLLILALPWLWRFWVQWRFHDRIYTPTEPIPAAGVAIVFGAGLRRDGSPTPVLHDRVATAVDLYQAGIVKKLLMTGDNRFLYYNEPEAMRQLALHLGVPDQDIILDYAGRRTYDSCYRAKEIFAVDQAIVVTQRFHLDRAMYLCDSLGVQTIGVVADRGPYRQQSWWDLRELAATAYAWFDINLLRPRPVLGEQIPIEIS
jgi:SanA protein